MFEKLGPEAREIVVLSQKIAQSMGHGEVRGEHLLLALFKQLNETLASEFADIGITYEQIFSAVKADHPGKDSVLESDLTELSPEAQIIIARSAHEAKRLNSELILPKHLSIAFEWYGVAERGNFYAWELMKKSGPEHKIRALFGNIEFRTPTKEKPKIVARRKYDSPKPSETDVVNIAQAEARRLGHDEIGPEHFLLAFTKDYFAKEVLTLAGVDLAILRTLLETKFPQSNNFVPLEIPFSALSKKILEEAFKCARELGDNFISNEHLFQSFFQIAKETDIRAWSLLEQNWNIDSNALDSIIKRKISERKISTFQKFPVNPEPSESSNRKQEPIFDWVTAENFKFKHELLDAAQDAALKHGHNKVGTSYLLYGLSRTPNTVASKILDLIGLHPNALNQLLLEKYGRGPLQIKEQMLYSLAIPLIFDYAKEIASENHSKTIESEHFLQAIVRMGKRFDGCVAWEMICSTGKQHLVETMLTDPTRLHELSPQKNSEIKQPDKNLGRTDFFSKTTVNLLYLAQEESVLLKHNTIEPEHLFLAMQAMPSLDVLDLIKSLNLDVDISRRVVERFAGKGKGVKNKDLTLGAATKTLLESAFSEARQLGKSQIEPLDIMHAIAKINSAQNAESVLAKTLQELQLKPLLIVEEIMKMLQQEVTADIKCSRQHVSDTSEYQLPKNFSPTSLRVVENAHSAASRFGYPKIEPEHLLLGLVKETSNEVSSLFISRGVCAKMLEAECSKFKERGPGASSHLFVSDIVQEIFNLASKECSDEVEPQDLLGYLILSMDLTTINVLRSLGLEDLLEGAADYAPPAALLNFLNSTHMDHYFYSNALKILLRAQELTRQFGHRSTAAEHLLLALLEWNEDPVIKALIQHGLKLDKLKTDLRAIEGVGSTFNTKEIPLAQSTIDAMRKATDLVDELKSGALEPGHLMLGLLTNQSKTTKRLLSKYNLPVDINDQLIIALGGKDEK